MAEATKVATKQDLQPGDALCVEVNGQKIALFNVEGNYYALDDTCTHVGGSLSQGEVSATSVTCPWHGAQFELETGNVVRAPAQDSVGSYKVIVEGDEIKIETPE